jgi:predicted nucleotidyltransferase
VDHFREFLNVLKAMEDEGVDYILIGGFAVILHGLPRFTVDMDFFVKMAENNIQKLRRALYLTFGDSEIEELTFDELQRYPVIRYGTPNGFHIDIMAQLGEIAIYEDLEYEIMEVEGQKIKVATAESLLKLKEGTIRPEDKADARFLIELLKRRKGKDDDRKI